MAALQNIAMCDYQESVATGQTESRDATSWNFLGAMWAPEIKILVAHKEIKAPTMK